MEITIGCSSYSNILKELQVVCVVEVEFNHGDEVGRLAAASIVYTPTIRHHSVLLHHLYEIFQHPLHGVLHAAKQQSIDGPIRVPVVKFSAKAIKSDY